MFQQNPSAAFQELVIVQVKVRELNRYQYFRKQGNNSIGYVYLRNLCQWFDTKPVGLAVRINLDSTHSLCKSKSIILNFT